VDVGTLIAAARTRWLAAGVLREERVDFATVRNEYELVIDCTGGGAGPFDYVPWHYSKGESLTVAIDGLTPDVVINRGHWILPLSAGRAKVGATHCPGRRDLDLTPEARSGLEAGLATMTSQPYSVTGQQVGIRTYLGDKRPIVGRHPGDAGLGILNALGAKGTLFAPALARQWVHHLREGVPFDPEVDAARVWRATRVAAVA
jgi:glycine/D-amino acid oxidase-like deaminating enzyme